MTSHSFSRHTMFRRVLCDLNTWVNMKSVCNIKWVFKWRIMEKCTPLETFVQDNCKILGYWIGTFMLVFMWTTRLHFLFDMQVTVFTTEMWTYMLYFLFNWNLYFCASNAWCNLYYLLFLVLGGIFRCTSIT